MILFVCAGADAQNFLKDLANRAKNAVEQNVGNKVERGVNNALDGKLFKGKKADTPGFINWLSTPLLKHTPDWLLFLAMKYVGKYQK